ncbi:MAG: hypothetical protein KF878_18855 [Planctomycetes bacterium]|nr:hypothetical protein [Planctomycetota bacterium]
MTTPRALAAWPLLAALAVALLLLPWRPAGAQGAPRAWEHRVFRMDPVDYRDKADYLEILRANNNDPQRAEPDFHQHVLHVLGREGWELVQMDRARPNLVYFYLKRPAR